MSVVVTGITAVTRKLERIDKEAARAAGRAAIEGAKEVAKEARNRAPVRTGELKRSIKHGRGDTKGSARAGTNLWRAHFAEFGTVKAAAQPYLHPAFESLRDEIVDKIIAAEMRGAIRGALK